MHTRTHSHLHTLTSAHALTCVRTHTQIQVHASTGKQVWQTWNTKKHASPSKALNAGSPPRNLHTNEPFRVNLNTILVVLHFSGWCTSVFRLMKLEFSNLAARWEVLRQGRGSSICYWDVHQSQHVRSCTQGSCLCPSFKAPYMNNNMTKRPWAEFIPVMIMKHDWLLDIS